MPDEVAPLVIEPRVALCTSHGRALPWPEGFAPLGLWLLMAMLAAPEVFEMVPKTEDGKADLDYAMPVLREWSPWCEQPFIDQREFRRVHELCKTAVGRGEVFQELGELQAELRQRREANG